MFWCVRSPNELVILKQLVTDQEALIGYIANIVKGTDFNKVTDEEIARIEPILNTRGRAPLGYYSPYDIFMQHRV